MSRSCGILKRCILRLVLASLLLSVDVRAAGGVKWYDEEYEYNFVEAMILILLVIIALAFETSWHRVAHIAHKTSYRYGDLHDQYERELLGEDKEQVNNHGSHVDQVDSHGNVRHKRLWEEFVHRTGSEFMTLGVLAFIVFMFNNAAGFEAVARIQRDFPLPQSEYEWLHMVEAVHMKLFIAMVLYFSVVARMVAETTRKTEQWERFRLQRVKDTIQKGKTPKAQRLVLHEKVLIDPKRREYNEYRNYFIESVIEWKDQEKELYRRLVKKLELDPQDDPDEVDDEALREAVADRFSLAAYLAMNVEECVTDCIHLHHSTWLALVFTFGTFALLHHFAKIGLFELSIVVLIVFSLLVACMRLYLGRARRNIRSFLKAAHARHQEHDQQWPKTPGGSPIAESETTGRSNKSSLPELELEDTGISGLFFDALQQTVSTEIRFARALQMGLFLLSYVFARNLMDFHDWRAYPIGTLALCAVFAILFIVLSSFMAAWVPSFLAIMALPPYVDKKNMDVFLEALTDDHTLQTSQAHDCPPMMRSRSRTRTVNTLEDQVSELRQRVESMEMGRFSGSEDAGRNGVQVTLSEMGKRLTDLESKVANCRWTCDSL